MAEVTVPTLIPLAMSTCEVTRPFVGEYAGFTAFPVRSGNTVVGRPIGRPTLPPLAPAQAVALDLGAPPTVTRLVVLLRLEDMDVEVKCPPGADSDGRG